MNEKRSLGFLVAVALLLPATPVFGATVSDSGVFSFPLSPNSTSVALDLFNPALGTLQAVQLLIDGGIQADITGENDSAIGGNMTVNLTGLLTASASGLTANAGVLQSAGPVAVSATDGTPGSGPDFVNFGTVAGVGSDDDTTLSVGAYLGPGTFNANVSGNGGFNISGVTDSTLQISNFQGSGTVTVIYTYEPTSVPEPNSLSLIAVALAGIGGVRRRRVA